MNTESQASIKYAIPMAHIIHFQPAGFMEGNFPFDEKWIARRLISLDILTSGIHLITDEGALEGAIRYSLDKADLIIIIGGLGKNTKDASKKAVAKITGRKLVLSLTAQKESQRDHLQPSDALSENVSSSDLVPQQGVFIPNPEKGFPGFILEHLQRIFLCLPDYYSPAFPMMLEEGLSWVKEYFHGQDSLQLAIFRTIGLTEEQVRTRLDDLMRSEDISGRKVSWVLLSHMSGIDVEMRVPALDMAESHLLTSLKQEIRARLGRDLYGEGSRSLEEVAGSLLVQHHHTLSVAESCTGGLIADRLTDVPGSSEYFHRGLVVYSNRTKQELLGVREATLRSFGAVSEQTVREMCHGLRLHSRTDLALAVSGIAGPGGGSLQKPVGLVYIGLYDGQRFQVKEFRFQGSRREVKYRASQMALDMVRRYYHEE
jgi:nicotinamide-nucleotide amidase